MAKAQSKGATSKGAAAKKGGTASKAPKKASTARTGISGQGAKTVQATTFEQPTRADLVAKGQGKNEKHLHNAALPAKGQKKQVTAPVSLPENTNQGAAPYGAPKENYGGGQVTLGMGAKKENPNAGYKPLSDVIAHAGNTDLPNSQ